MADDDLSYFVVSDKSIAADVARPSIKLFKQFDELENTFSGDVNAEGALKDFIGANSFATVIIFDDRAIGKIF